MRRRFITQYPLSPPMNDVSNLYKRIRLDEQLQLFDEIIKKVKVKKPQPILTKSPMLISAKKLKIQSERNLVIRSPRIIEQKKKLNILPIIKTKPSISGWEVNNNNDSYFQQ